jgi:uncharacterized protein
MTRELPENLCTSCGLCCDGSLFADIELKNRRESLALESFGLAVEDGDDAELLMQPCGALKGTRCSIYHYRPTCCRSFECRLLRDVEEGKRTITDAREIVRQTRDLIEQIERRIGSKAGRKHLPLKERFLEASERCDAKNRTALEESMQHLENRIEVNFIT